MNSFILTINVVVLKIVFKVGGIVTVVMVGCQLRWQISDGNLG